MQIVLLSSGQHELLALYHKINVSGLKYLDGEISIDDLSIDDLAEVGNLYEPVEYSSRSLV